jgi:hypothetical protein
MLSSRISSLALLSINKGNSEKLLKCPIPVPEVFGTMKNKRLRFQI